MTNMEKRKLRKELAERAANNRSAAGMTSIQARNRNKAALRDLRQKRIKAERKLGQCIGGRELGDRF